MACQIEAILMTLSHPHRPYGPSCCKCVFFLYSYAAFYKISTDSLIYCIAWFLCNNWASCSLVL